MCRRSGVRYPVQGRSSRTLRACSLCVATVAPPRRPQREETLHDPHLSPRGRSPHRRRRARRAHPGERARAVRRALPRRRCERGAQRLVQGRRRARPHAGSVRRHGHCGRGGGARAQGARARLLLRGEAHRAPLGRQPRLALSVHARPLPARDRAPARAPPRGAGRRGGAPGRARLVLAHGGRRQGHAPPRRPARGGHHAVARRLRRRAQRGAQDARRALRGIHLRGVHPPGRRAHPLGLRHARRRRVLLRLAARRAGRAAAPGGRALPAPRAPRPGRALRPDPRELPPAHGRARPRRRRGPGSGVDGGLPLPQPEGEPHARGPRLPRRRRGARPQPGRRAGDEHRHAGRA